jgi:hypothetical protein
MSKQHLFNKLPFVVITRTSEKLMENLLRDNYPIIFEGLHTCYYLSDDRLKGRIKIVRMHNIEQDYYGSLQKAEHSLFKKIYFGMEAKKLEHFEKNLRRADAIAAISIPDTKALSSRYKNVHHIPPFHANSEVRIKEGKGNYCLYHGNLEVGENNKAALYLVNQVFSKIQIPFIIAGRNPSSELRAAASNHSNITIKANLSTPEIEDLIKNAQVNVLPTFQATGIKLKLLAALFSGRYCVVNSPMVVNTSLEPLCSVEDLPDMMASEIVKLFNQPFDMEEKQKRDIILFENFSNDINAKKLLALL